jgi:hypothetical protein
MSLSTSMNCHTSASLQIISFFTPDHSHETLTNNPLAILPSPNSASHLVHISLSLPRHLLQNLVFACLLCAKYLGHFTDIRLIHNSNLHSYLAHLEVEIDTRAPEQDSSRICGGTYLVTGDLGEIG